MDLRLWNDREDRVRAGSVPPKVKLVLSVIVKLGHPSSYARSLDCVVKVERRRGAWG